MKIENEIRENAMKIERDFHSKGIIAYLGAMCQGVKRFISGCKANSWCEKSYDKFKSKSTLTSSILWPEAHSSATERQGDIVPGDCRKLGQLLSVNKK